MKQLKRILFRLFFLPVWLSAVIAIPSFALLIYVFAVGLEDTPWTYLSYAASAYALTVLSTAMPRIVRFIRGGYAAHPLLLWARDTGPGERFLSDPVYRAEIGLYAGLMINLLYAAVKLVSGIVFHSLWFGALAVYYLLLSILRFLLLHHARRRGVGRDALSEWRRYRLCGMILLMMNQALAVVVALVVYRSSGFAYPGYLTYAMAGYTFYAVINAVRNIVKFRRHGSPVMLAAKAVSLVAALVSLLSLETAMLTQFGAADQTSFRRIMTASTGFAICTIVLLMAIFMIIKSTRRIRALKA